MRIAVVLAGALVLGSSLGVAALVDGSAPSFARARSYSTGHGPWSVAIGDLNGDGKLDLATANINARTVSVLLNGGDGSFQARRAYGARREPASVAIGDLNGDGNPDLAIANAGADRVSVLLNRGDGSFQAKVDYATEDLPDSVAIGDLNGDGKPDLATANNGEDSASVLLNRGDGTFEAKRDYPTGDHPYSAAIGDLNGDGKLDLTTANFEGSEGGSVSVLLNRGDGTLQTKRDYAAEGGSVAIGDLNGDGKPDLVTAGVSGLRDLNGDGKPDLVTTNASVRLNSGDGTFRTRRDYAAGGDSVAVGDLNGDGKLDLATANGADDENSVSVLMNRGDGTFQAKRDYATGAGPRSVAIGDLNGDGKPELVTANFGDGGADTISVLINRPGLCTVQNVTGTTLQTAKRRITRANCRVGTIRRAYSKRVNRGRVIAQRPKFGAVLPGGSKVNLVVSSRKRLS